jgi:hypothetical protein
VARGAEIAQGDGSASNGVGYLIHDNDITTGSGPSPGSGISWCTGPGDYYHLEGIHTYSQSTTGITGPAYIYNNYIHGVFCVVGGTANFTASIFWEAHVTGGTGPNTADVFNNLIVMSGGHPGDGAIYPQSGTNGFEYNNTVNCLGADSSSLGIEFGGGTNTFSNNIIENCNEATLFDGGTVSGNNNDYYNIGGAGWSGATFATWKSAHSMDSTSITTNPNLTIVYLPNSGSPVISAATNLHSLGIAPLDLDKAGLTRPTSAAWDMGAYQFVSSPGGVVVRRRR